MLKKHYHKLTHISLGEKYRNKLYDVKIFKQNLKFFDCLLKQGKKKSKCF